MRPRSFLTGLLGATLFASVVLLPVGVRQAKAAVTKTRAAAPPPGGHALVTAPPPTAKKEPIEADVVPLGDRREPELEASEEPAPAQMKPAPRVVAPAPSAPLPAAPALDEEALKRDVNASLVQLPMCRMQAGPEGPGMAQLTFRGDGTVLVGLSNGYANTPRGACVGRRFASAARTFDGPPVVMRVRFEL